MTETSTTEATPVQPPPPPAFSDALHDPSLLVSRRGEFMKLATDRVNHVAATVRTRFEQSPLRAQVRSAAHEQLQRAARALQHLADRIDPSRQPPAETPPANGAV
jgi:predicted metal-dependent RNase